MSNLDQLAAELFPLCHARTAAGDFAGAASLLRAHAYQADAAFWRDVRGEPVIVEVTSVTTAAERGEIAS